MPNFLTLRGTIKELCNYKVLKMGQNLHANMEGFRRATLYVCTLHVGATTPTRVPAMENGVLHV